jgi:hypothetical protein
MNFTTQASRRFVFAIICPFFFAAAQSTRPAREFDAVSVKPDAQKGPYVSSWRVDPAMIRMTGYTLKGCVQQAYGLKPYQVQPKGPGVDRYRLVRH